MAYIWIQCARCVPFMHHTQPPYRRILQQSLLSRPASAHPKSPSPPPQPSNDDIEAVIQMATASRQNPDGRSGPPKDTRTQLFVGNVTSVFFCLLFSLTVQSSFPTASGGRISKTSSVALVPSSVLTSLSGLITDLAAMGLYCWPPLRMLAVRLTCSTVIRGRPEYSKSARIGYLPTLITRCQPPLQNLLSLH